MPRLTWADEDSFDYEWRKPDTLPRETRVLGCFYNIWGFKYVTEVYIYKYEENPETILGMPVNKLLGWVPIPEPIVGDMTDDF